MITKQPVEVENVIVYILNIQGLNFILPEIIMPGLEGMRQTWFVTVIAICYFFMVLLKKMRKVEMTMSNYIGKFIAWGTIVQISLAFLGVQISYFFQFFIGYFLAKREWLNKKNFKFVTIATIIFCVLRLVLRIICDGTIFYERVIAPLSFNCLSIMLIMTVLLIYDLYRNFFERLTSNVWWKILDLMSYPLFLSHYMFLTGPLRVDNFVKGEFQQTIVFIVLTVIIALTISLIADYKKTMAILKEGICLKGCRS